MRQQLNDLNPCTLFVGGRGENANAARAIVGKGRAEEQQQATVEEQKRLCGLRV
jgi:hypothetical protein